MGESADKGAGRSVLLSWPSPVFRGAPPFLAPPAHSGSAARRFCSVGPVGRAQRACRCSAAGCPGRDCRRCPRSWGRPGSRPSSRPSLFPSSPSRPSHVCFTFCASGGGECMLLVLPWWGGSRVCCVPLAALTTTAVHFFREVSSCSVP